MVVAVLIVLVCCVTHYFGQGFSVLLVCESRRNTGKGRCALCLGEEDAKHLLLDCRGTGNWRLQFVNDGWLNMNKEVAYRKMLQCTSKDQTRNVGRYLDTVECKWFNKTK